MVFAALDGLGLAGKSAYEKHVPEEYLRASSSQRLALLQGIMDTDGFVTPNKNSAGYVGIKITSEALARGVMELIESLGGYARISRVDRSATKSDSTGLPWHDVYAVSLGVPPGVNPFRLPRKADACTPRSAARFHRFVDTIEPDGEEKSVCIRVEAADHLYVTRSHILTHNTGNGLPLWQILKENTSIGPRLAGYNFSEKKPVAFDTRELKRGEKPEDLVIIRNIKDFSTDALRKRVDTKTIELPFDDELIGEWNGQTSYIVKTSPSDDGVVRRYGGVGNCHSLDAARMYAAAKDLEQIEALLEKPKAPAPVLAQFF
jgi:hypothetical protein